VLYAGVLAAGRLRDDAAIRIHLDRLTALVSSDPVATRLARWLRAEVSLAAGDWRSAQTQLDNRSADDRDTAQMRRPELLLRGQLALQAGQEAIWLALTERLQPWVVEHPRDAQAWQLLASAYSAQRQSLRALRAEAEARVAQLDLAAALDRLKAAQELLRQGGSLQPNADHIEASIIDTRRRQLESALREQALER
jgi:predicted Zn-dependent protease